MLPIHKINNSNLRIPVTQYKIFVVKRYDCHLWSIDLYSAVDLCQLRTIMQIINITYSCKYRWYYTLANKAICTINKAAWSLQVKYYDVQYLCHTMYRSLNRYLHTSERCRHIICDQIKWIILLYGLNEMFKGHPWRQTSLSVFKLKLHLNHI